MSPKPDPRPARPGISLTVRLATTLALIFAFGGVAVAFAALAYGRSAAQQSFDRLLFGAASQIARSISLRDGAVSVDIPATAFELLSLAPEDRVVYAVFGPDGGLVTGYDALKPLPRAATFANGEFTGEPVRLAQVLRPFAERTFSGTVSVVVGQTNRARSELAAEIARNALIAAALAGLVMSGLAVFAVRSALGPLNRIESDLRARAPQDLTPIGVAVPREISSLVETLNRFMARIDRQVGVMRNLIADASHQLRTPIAALRAQAELAAEEADPERLRGIIGRIHTRSVTLGRLTDQLLSHAMIIHRADAAPLEPLDLRTVAIRAIEETDHALFGSRALPRLDLPEDPVWSEGDALSLVEACKNLVGNALRHGAEPVALSVAADGDRARIAVTDAGPGIPEAHWPDAGARYARDTGVSPNSAGLGLAIVEAVAAAHGGRLEFRRAEGFEAAIVLPLSGHPA